MSFVTISLYILFLFLVYLLVRRMITSPLDETAREANLVANLAFDEFQPDLKRGDEIGELNRALSEMAATLHTRWDSERDLEDKRPENAACAHRRVRRGHRAGHFARGKRALPCRYRAGNRPYERSGAGNAGLHPP